MIAALLFALLFSAPRPAQQIVDTVAIMGATLIDGSGGLPIKDSIVVYRGNRIVAVGKMGSVPISDDTQVILAKGKWLLPGLIDMHVHMDEVPSASEFTQFGVTAVRDVGSRLVTIQKLKARASAGPGLPHVYWMGRNIDEGTPSWWGAVAVKNASGVNALLGDMARQGVDGVKLYVNAGPRVAAAVITQAHERGWPVTAHLGKTMPSEAASLGIDNLEHVAQLFIELKSDSKGNGSGFGSSYVGVPGIDLAAKPAARLISSLARHHVAITPTLTVALMPALGDKGSAPYYSGWDPVQASWKKEWARDYWSFLTPNHWKPEQYNTAIAANKKYSKMVGLLYHAGAPLIAGTDTPAPWVLPGAGLLVEMQLMNEAGVPAGEVIRAATGRAAEVLHRDDDIGEIRPGRLADFVLLNADPLQDIKNLHRIDRVYMDGKLLKRTGANGRSDH